jgi:ribonuclease-3
MSELNFISFIQGILEKHAKINRRTILKLTGDEQMIVFERAFTHPSVNKKDNYEQLEFAGDTTANSVIAYYIIRRFPSIKEEGRLTMIKHDLITNKVFGNLARKLGFLEHIRADEEIKKQKTIIILGNVFESFIGALVMVVDSTIHEHTGYGLAYAIIAGLLDQEDIRTEIDVIKSAKTKLKEMLESQAIKSRGLTNVELVYEDVGEKEEREHNIVARIIVGAKKICTYKGGEKYIIGKGRSVRRADAEAIAARQALRVLERKYGVTWHEGKVIQVPE